MHYNKQSKSNTSNTRATLYTSISLFYCCCRNHLLILMNYKIKLRYCLPAVAVLPLTSSHCLTDWLSADVIHHCYLVVVEHFLFNYVQVSCTRNFSWNIFKLYDEHSVFSVIRDRYVAHNQVQVNPKNGLSRKHISM